MRNAIVFPISSRPPLVCGGEHPSAGAHQDGEAGGAMQKVGIFLKVFERYKHGLRDFFVGSPKTTRPPCAAPPGRGESSEI